LKKFLKNRKGLSHVVVAIILIVAVVAVSIAFVAAWRGMFTPTSTKDETRNTEPNYLVPQKISDVTSKVYRVVDEDYGIVLYIVDTYSLGSAPSISGVRIGEVKVTPVDGVSQITNKGAIPVIYRLVDLEMNTVSYIVDTYTLGTSPSIVTFSLVDK